VLQFTSPAFISDSGKKALAFGPTLRINRGGTYSVQIANQMVDPNPEKPGDNAKPFYGPMDTNFHSHGLHFPTGGCWQHKG
jgi:FtsP/CotA-like multicopper oxidase with cupredoxin domain